MLEQETFSVFNMDCKLFKDSKGRSYVKPTTGIDLGKVYAEHLKARKAKEMENKANGNGNNWSKSWKQ